MFSDLGRSTYEQDAHKIRPLVMERRQLTKGIAVGAVTVYINSLPRNVLGNQGYIVIDAYTSQCEVRKFTVRAGKALTVDALTYAHNKHDEVIFIDSCVLNPMWFGARGNGGADDTADLQSMIDQVPSTGGKIYGDGKYKITSTLNMKSHLRLEGPIGSYSGTATIDRGFKLVWAGSANGTMIKYNNCKYCELQGINFDGGGSAGVTAIVIDGTAPVYNYDFKNFNIQNCGTGIALSTSGTINRQVSDISFRNFEIANLGTAGKGIYTYSQNVDNILIEEGRFYNLRYGVYLDRGGFMKIAHCTAGFDTINGDFIYASIHDTLLLEGNQAESGTGYWMIIPSSSPANLNDPIVMINNITNLPIDIQKDRPVISIGNRYNSPFTLSGDSVKVHSIGDIFTGTADFLLTGVNPAVERNMAFADNYIGVDSYVKTVSGEIRPALSLSAWVTSGTPTATFGLLPEHCYVAGAHMNVTQAFNASGTNLISVGWDGTADAYAQDVDVSTTGIKSLLAGAWIGYQYYITTARAYYTYTGTAPTTGKAMVILDVMPGKEQP